MFCDDCGPNQKRRVLICFSITLINCMSLLRCLHSFMDTIIFYYMKNFLYYWCRCPNPFFWRGEDIERKVSSGDGYKNVLGKSNFSNIGEKYKQEYIQENILFNFEFWYIASTVYNSSHRSWTKVCVIFLREHRYIKNQINEIILGGLFCVLKFYWYKIYHFNFPNLAFFGKTEILRKVFFLILTQRQ